MNIATIEQRVEMWYKYMDKMYTDKPRRRPTSKKTARQYKTHADTRAVVGIYPDGRKVRFVSALAAADKFGVSRRAIYNAIADKQKTSAGLWWLYAETIKRT